MKSIPFTKMHGCGNDYIYINLFDKDIDYMISNKSIFTKKVSDRHFGIGSDGVIFISPPSMDIFPSIYVDFKMEIYNADGSLAEMCGNGIRCATVFAQRQGIFSKEKRCIIVESAGNLRFVELITENDAIISVKVNMGKPEFRSEHIPVISTKPTIVQEPLTIFPQNGSILNETLPIRTYLYDITCVSMGNPHCVIFTEDVSKIDLNYIGPLIENHDMFPNRTNVEFVQIITPNLIKMRVWERGSGETLACGTGCCAAVAAGFFNHLIDNHVVVQVPGGELSIFIDNHTKTIYMTGPAITVFEGTIM